MSVHTTIRPVTPNDHEVSPGSVPSTTEWRQGVTRHMLARLARVLELRAPAYAAGDPSPCCPGEYLRLDPYSEGRPFFPEDDTAYDAELP
jgi:hypothetical protein